jgi:hypothetical protein
MWIVFGLLSVLWCTSSSMPASQDGVEARDARPLRALHQPWSRITPDWRAH